MEVSVGRGGSSSNRPSLLKRFAPRTHRTNACLGFRRLVYFSRNSFMARCIATVRFDRLGGGLS